jgi:hypothetical protein
MMLRVQLKPRRGGLPIVTDAKEIMLFVFRRRGELISKPFRPSPSNQDLSPAAIVAPRRRKTRRAGFPGCVGYRQVTPTGFAPAHPSAPIAGAQ